MGVGVRWFAALAGVGAYSVWAYFVAWVQVMLYNIPGTFKRIL